MAAATSKSSASRRGGRGSGDGAAGRAATQSPTPPPPLQQPQPKPRRLEPALASSPLPSRQLRTCPAWDPCAELCLEAFENEWRKGSLAVGIAPLIALGGGEPAALCAALAAAAADSAAAGVTQAAQVFEPFPAFLLASREPGRGRAGVMSSAKPITAYSRLCNVSNKQAGVGRIALAIRLFQPWRAESPPLFPGCSHPVAF